MFLTSESVPGIADLNMADLGDGDDFMRFFRLNGDNGKKTENSRTLRMVLYHFSAVHIYRYQP